MASQSTPIINAFTAGELSPHLEGRTDHEKYYCGCRRLENFIPRPHGSVYKRPGTRFVARAKYADRAARLIPFDFNSTASQSYVIEMGDGYLRFYKDGGVITDDEGEPCEVASPWTADMIWSVNFVQSCDVLYLVHPEARPQSLTRAGHADWTLAPLEFAWPGADHEMADGNGDGLADGRAGDTVTIPEGRAMEVETAVHGVGPDGDEAWFAYQGEGLFDALLGDGDRILTFAASPDHDSGQIERVHDASGNLNDLYWRRLDAGHCMPEDWGPGNWPSVVALYEDRLVLGATPNRPLTLWLSATGEYEDLRLNTSSYEDGVQDSPLDDDAIELSLSGARVNPIRWIVDQQELLVGTNAGEVKVWSGSSSEGLTPSRAFCKRQSAYGSGPVQPQAAADAVLFVSRTGKKIRRMAYELSSDRYTSPEITLLAEHVTGRGVADMDYAREPDGVLWTVRSDGVLAACTYLPQQNVAAWHRHILGASAAGAAACESVACIPGQGGDETWLLVRRTVDGGVLRSVERMAGAWDGGDAGDAFLVDCGLSSGRDVEEAAAESPVRITVAGHGFSTGDTVLLDGLEGMEEVNGGQYAVSVLDADQFTLDGTDGSGFAAWTGGGRVWRRAQTVSGLGHLEGEAVQVLVDGASVGPLVVAGGAVALPRAAFKVHAGLGYGAVLQPMRLEAGVQGGTAQTKRKRIMAVSLRFRNTVGGAVCPGDDVADKYERVLPRGRASDAGAAPAPFSGDREVRFAGGFDRDGLFTVRQDEPLPMTVICCVPRVQGGE
ncbi:ubiquitin-activating E1 FCCH domain-containing protein [Desulfocurvus sp. DL9XJH121]